MQSLHSSAKPCQEELDSSWLSRPTTDELLQRLKAETAWLGEELALLGRELEELRGQLYVVRRKISSGHRTWAGAWKHAILLSVLEACYRRGEAFLTTVERALRQTLPSTG